MEPHSHPSAGTASLVPGHAEPVHALVVGASRGIGAAIAERLARHPQVEVLHLASRHPECLATALQGGPAVGDRLCLHACDLVDEASIARLGAAIAARSPRLHLVINTAGLLHDEGIAPEKSVRHLSREALARSFAVNAFGPILLARELLARLVHGDAAVFASLSARVGSIGDNRLGGWYAYRASKAAQNQLLRTFAIELARLNRRAIVLGLHPGTVDTALSKPFSGNVPAERLFTPAFAAERLLAVIAARTPNDSGGLYAWDGAPVPW